MNKENANKIIVNLENGLEKQISYVLLHFQNLTGQQLTQRLDKNSWSIAECIQHLNSYGDYYLPFLKRELKTRKKVALNKTQESSWLGSFFVDMIEPNKFAKELKARKKEVPQMNISPHEIISTHLSQQEMLLVYIRLFQNHDLAKKNIPTSITSRIKLNSLDILQFLIAHNFKYINQASKIYNLIIIN